MTNKQTIDGVSRDPIYQVMYRGDGGGGWSDAEKASYDAKTLHPNHWMTRIVYAAQPQGEVESLRTELRVARAQGRAEVVEMIIALEAEAGLDEFIGSHQIGCTGEWGSHWKEEELRQHFDVDPESSGELELARHSGYEIALLEEGQDTLRAQLAERDALLREALCHAQRIEPMSVSLFNRIDATLSASAEPKPRGEVFGYWRVPKGLPLQGMFLAYDKDRSETDIQNAIDHGFSVTRLYAEPSHSGDSNEMVAKVVLPFTEKVIRKLQRYQECMDDGQGADIGRHWFDLLTQLGLLNRVQRSPALWEITQQGEDALDVAKLNGLKP